MKCCSGLFDMEVASVVVAPTPMSWLHGNQDQTLTMGENLEERREGETRETSGGMLLGSAGHTSAQTGAPQIIAWAVNLDPTGSAFACPLPQMKSAPSRTLAVPLVCLPHQVPALLPLALGLTHPHLRTTAIATATLLTPTTSPDNYNHNHDQHPSLPRPAPSIRFGSISSC